MALVVRGAGGGDAGLSSAEVSLVTGDRGGGGGLVSEAEEDAGLRIEAGGETDLTGWNQAGGDWCLVCWGWSEHWRVSLRPSLASTLAWG